jgi:hypothetical protein
MNKSEAKAFVDEFYKKVAARWNERVTRGPFMKNLLAGTLSRAALRLFFKNWGAYTIEINTLEAASYHKHIHFFRSHRDLMAPMAQKLADELIHPEPPGHVHVVLKTAAALESPKKRFSFRRCSLNFVPRSISKGRSFGKARWQSFMPRAQPRNRPVTGLPIVSRP